MVSTKTASAVCMTTISAKEIPDQESELYDSVRKYFQNESCDFGHSKDEKQEFEDELAIQQFKRTIEYVPTAHASLIDPPGRYRVTLP